MSSDDRGESERATLVFLKDVLFWLNEGSCTPFNEHTTFGTCCTTVSSGNIIPWGNEEAYDRFDFIPSPPWWCCACRPFLGDVWLAFKTLKDSPCMDDICDGLRFSASMGGVDPLVVLSFIRTSIDSGGSFPCSMILSSSLGCTNSSRISNVLNWFSRLGWFKPTTLTLSQMPLQQSWNEIKRITCVRKAYDLFGAFSLS